MMSLTFGLFTQVSGSGPLGPLVGIVLKGKNSVIAKEIWLIIEGTDQRTR